MIGAYLFLVVVLLALGLLDSPPQVAGEVYSTTLVWLLQQLAAVQSGLGDKSVVILAAELLTTAGQRATDDTNGLELASRIADGLFVSREGGCKEFVGNVFIIALSSDLSGGNEKSKHQVWHARSRDSGVK